MDLSAHYKRWEEFANTVDEDGAPADRRPAAPPAPLTKEQLKDVSFSLGKPLTEEQFAEYRRHNNTQVVGSVRR